MITRSLTSAAFAAATLLAACTGGSSEPIGGDAGTTTTGDASNGQPAVAIPQVIFAGTIANGSNADCRDSGDLFTVGTFGPPSTPVQNGAAFGQGTVDVSCSVLPATDGVFRVDATVNLSGATGGLYKMEGAFKPTGESTDIRVAEVVCPSAVNTSDDTRKCEIAAELRFENCTQ